MTKYGTVEIKVGDEPKGRYHNESSETIKQWITGTDPGTVSGAGQTFRDASSKIQQAVTALSDNHKKIIEIWKGKDAELAGDALNLLQASGTELVKAFQQIGDALSNYSGHLTFAQTEINKEVKVPGGTSDYGTESEAELVKKGLEDTRARRVLHELNQKIVEVYGKLPDSFNYSIPTVVPDVPEVEVKPPSYPTGGTNVPTWSGTGSDTGGSYNNVSGGSGNGSTGNGSNPGGSNPGGSNPGGSNPGGSDPSNPGGSDPNNPGGSDPNNPGTPGPDTPTTPPENQNPGQPQTPAPGNEDGTVPSVIGDQDHTTTDGADRTDPNQTDMASYQPPVLTTPTTAVPPTTLTPTPSFSTPMTPGGPGSPGIPSVIGSPGVGGPGAQSGLAAARAGSGMMPGGMPFMPFMGGGGAGAGEYGDMERNTYMPEDSSAWGCGNETTDPVIG